MGKKVKTQENMPAHWFARVLSGDLDGWLFTKNPPAGIEISMFEIRCDEQPEVVIRCPVRFLFRSAENNDKQHLVQFLSTEIERIKTIWKPVEQKRESQVKSEPQAALGLKQTLAKSLIF